jgi:hypothetical protein
MDKHLSDTSAIQNGMKQGDALSHCFSILLYIMPLGKSEWTKREWNKLDTSASDLRWYVSLLNYNMRIGETKYMFMPRQQNAGQNRIIRIANKSSKIVAKFKYFGRTLWKQISWMNILRSD